jgi:hypothetical protein
MKKIVLMMALMFGSMNANADMGETTNHELCDEAIESVGVMAKKSQNLATALHLGRNIMNEDEINRFKRLAARAEGAYQKSLIRAKTICSKNWY